MGPGFVRTILLPVELRKCLMGEGLPGIDRDDFQQRFLAFLLAISRELQDSQTGPQFKRGRNRLYMGPEDFLRLGKPAGRAEMLAGGPGQHGALRVSRDRLLEHRVQTGAGSLVVLRKQGPGHFRCQQDFGNPGLRTGQGLEDRPRAIPLPQSLMDAEEPAEDGKIARKAPERLLQGIAGQFRGEIVVRRRIPQEVGVVQLGFQTVRMRGRKFAEKRGGGLDITRRAVFSATLAMRG